MMPTPSAEALRRWLWIWDAYFTLCYLVVLVVVAAAPGSGAITGPRLASAAMLTLLALWYVVLGRPAVRGADGSRRSWLFLAGLVVLFVAAVAFAQASAFALFALCPMVFMCFSLPQAVLIVAALNALPPIVAAIRAGSFESAHSLVPAALLGLAFAVLVGTYIDRIAQQSAERARLITELEASRAEVSRLSHEAGVAAERARLAAEIHDTLAQGLASIITLVQAAQSETDTDRDAVSRRLTMALRTARESLAEARAMVTALTPTDLTSSTLDAAIRRQVDRLAEETGINATYAVGGSPYALPTSTEVVLLRAAQEALSNLRKHAHAGVVFVRLAYTDDSVTLSVTDDGVGFDPTATSHGFGLPGMRARAEQASGTLRIDTAPGQGTTLELEVRT